MGATVNSPSPQVSGNTTNAGTPKAKEDSKDKFQNIKNPRQLSAETKVAFELDQLINGGVLGISSNNLFGMRKENEDRILELLKDRSADEVQKIEAAYRDLRKRELRGDLVQVLAPEKNNTATNYLNTQATTSGRGNGQEFIPFANLTPNEQRDNAIAYAGKLHDMLFSFDVDENGVYSALTGLTTEERAAVQSAYNYFFKEDGEKDLLDRDLRNRLDSTEYQHAKELLTNGRLSPGKALFFALNESINTDEIAVISVLRSVGQGEIEAVKKDYRDYSRSLGKVRDLEQDLEDKLGGRDLFLAKWLLQGQTKAINVNDKEERRKLLEELLKKTSEYYEFERSGTIGQQAMDLLSKRGPIVDWQMKRMKELYEKAKSSAEVSVEDLREVAVLSGYVLHDLAMYGGAKDSFAQTSALAASIVLALSAEALTGSLATPVAVPLVSAVSAGSYAGIRYSVEGNAYDSENLPLDVAAGTVPGLVSSRALGAVRLGGGAAGGTSDTAVAAVTELGKSTARAAVGMGTINGAVTAANPQVWQNGPTEGGQIVWDSFVTGGYLGLGFKGVQTGARILLGRALSGKK